MTHHSGLVTGCRHALAPRLGKTRSLRTAGLALCVIVLAFILPPRSTASAATLVGPKAYYLALGDSLAFGYQPDFNYGNGYAPDFYHNLQTHGTSHFEDLG
ncbi:MAG: hypothetical protein M3Z66_14615, partial [Chloroflexota bacterium]|nr:hypothetical protein [Chloroflexota bacterium]